MTVAVRSHPRSASAELSSPITIATFALWQTRGSDRQSPSQTCSTAARENLAVVTDHDCGAGAANEIQFAGAKLSCSTAKALLPSPLRARARLSSPVTARLAPRAIAIDRAPVAAHIA
jgi:hypothetical protein